MSTAEVMTRPTERYAFMTKAKTAATNNEMVCPECWDNYGSRGCVNRISSHCMTCVACGWQACSH